jgi:hypothetical protein
MYRCQEAGCKNVSQPNQRAFYRVLATRERVYPERRMPGSEGGWKTVDPGGRGTEIVREIKVCASCAKKASEPTSEASA